jgi:hypothetical protein
MDVLARPSLGALGATNCKRKHEMKLDMAQTVLRDVPSKEKKVSAVESNLNVEAVDHTSSRAIECASKRSSPGVLGLTNSKHKHKVKLTMVNHRTENQRKSGAVPSTERKVSAVISKARKESMYMQGNGIVKKLLV